MKRTGILLFLALILFLVAGTVFAGGQQGGASGGSGKASLEYWIAGDPRRTPVYQDSIADFMKANPNIEVKVVEEVGDNQQIQQKLMTMISAGSAPGVIHVDVMYVADMARAGTVIDLSGFPGAKALSDSIAPGAQESMIVNGKIYGYPIRANSIQLVYNKKMFREAGLDPSKPPKTMDELINYAVKLTKKDAAGNIQVYGFETGMTPDPHWTIHALSPIFWTFGGQYQNPDGSSGIGSDASVKAVELWKKIMIDMKISPTARIANGFATEKIAMALDGEWNIMPWKKDFPNLEFGFATIPVAVPGATPKIPLGGRATVIPKNVKSQDAAWKLIQWVLSDKEQMRYTSAEVGLTPKLSLAKDPWFNSNPEYKQVLNDMQYVKPKAAQNILQMNTFWADAIQQVIMNGADIKSSLAAANKKYNDLLGK